MEQEFNELLAKLDNAVSIIQELCAQLQQARSNGGKEKNDIDKKAEFLAGKAGISYGKAQSLIKQAAEKNVPVESLLDLVGTLVEDRHFTPFGRVASDERGFSKTASSAEAKFKEMEAQLLEEISL